jgi:hypothetical protein
MVSGSLCSFPEPIVFCVQLRFDLFHELIQASRAQSRMPISCDDRMHKERCSPAALLIAGRVRRMVDANSDGFHWFSFGLIP